MHLKIGNLILENKIVLLMLIWFENLYCVVGLLHIAAATAAKSLQSCPTLCDPTDGSPSGCPVPGILQARTLEWVAISISNAWKWTVKVKSLGRVWLFTTPWTAAYQAPPSMGFSRQEEWGAITFSVLHINCVYFKAFLSFPSQMSAWISNPEI